MILTMLAYVTQKLDGEAPPSAFEAGVITLLGVVVFCWVLVGLRFGWWMVTGGG